MKMNSLTLLPLALTFASPMLLAASSVAELSEQRCKKMVEAGVLTPDAPVQCDRLRAVNFDYMDFDGKPHNNGEVIVLDAVASHVATIFERLYALKFPIQQAQPIYHYQGDDNQSMAANNTSAFNYRPIAGKSSLSIHAYGLAIDINPKQNPFVEFSEQGQSTITPVEGVKYANRMKYRYAKAERKGFAEDVLTTFADSGFLYWGGFWNTPIDYQHFQVSRDMAYLMTAMTTKNAILFFDNYVGWYQSCKAMYPGAYAEHRVNDYSVYLKTNLNVTSLKETFKQSPEKVLGAIKAPLIRSALCVRTQG
jgi:hypothetical protein